MYSIVLTLLKHRSIFYMSYCKIWYQYLFLTRAHFLYNFLKHSHIFATEKRSDVYSHHSILYLLMSIHPPPLLLGHCNLLLKYGCGILITEIISLLSIATEKRSDVYSLHSILYLLMSIRPPSLLLGHCNLLLKYGYGILITEIISLLSIAIQTQKIDQKWHNTLKKQSVKLMWRFIKICWRSLTFTIAFLWEHLKKGAPKELCASGR